MNSLLDHKLRKCDEYVKELELMLSQEQARSKRLQIALEKISENPYNNGDCCRSNCSDVAKAALAPGGATEGTK